MANLGPWSCPSGKIPHLTRESAQKQLVIARGSKRGRDMHVYRCPTCDCYHIGHPRGSRWKSNAQRRGNTRGDLPKCS